MILREATIKYKGYDPDELSVGSNKRVCVSCNNCGRVRWIIKFAYRDLCKSCSAKINHADVAGKNYPLYGKFGKNNPNYGTKRNEITKKKMSKAHKGKIFTDKHKQAISEKLKGEKSPSWKGGLSFGKYCSKFNNKIKQQIRNQYNNCDYISGIHKSICNNVNLDVHHVDYNKMQGCESEWLLIPLSHSNHARTNKNRPFWNKLFIYALEIDKWYY